MSDFSDSSTLYPQPVRIQSQDGDVVKINPYGAHVLSWVTSAGREVLFLSPKAEYRIGAAIRGGVPVIFPQFAGMGKLPKHGFARTAIWELARITEDSAIFWLSETAESYQAWPHRFLVEYVLRIAKNRLEMTLSITNTDIAPFTFTAALHTYLQVQNLDKVAVVGLQGLHYRDSARGGQSALEAADRVIFQGEVDRLYLNTPTRLQLVDESQELSILATGFPDTVVWNPGAEKCAVMPDLEGQSYREFVCVEAAVAGRPQRLAPGENWAGSQTLLAQPV